MISRNFARNMSKYSAEQIVFALRQPSSVSACREIKEQLTDYLKLPKLVGLDA